MNVVPDRAIAEGEFRFLRVAEGEKIAAELTALARTIGAGERHDLDLRNRPYRAAGRSARPAALLVRAGGGARRLSRLDAWKSRTTEEGSRFPNFLPDPGRMPVLDGLGPVGGGMHTREEFLDLTSLARRIVLLADLFEADAAEGPSVDLRGSRPASAAHSGSCRYAADRLSFQNRPARRRSRTTVRSSA